MKEHLAFQRVLQETEQRVIAEERERYAKFREDIGRQLTQEENKLIKR